MSRKLDGLLQLTDRGLWCEAGGFYIDPWRPVDHAVITHAHADHARPGHGAYLCAEPGASILRQRIGEGPSIDTLAYGENRRIGEVTVSLHPAGHLLGSAQVRLERDGQVTVVTGDFKTQADRTCVDFQPVRCDTLIMESTFALPVYHWPAESTVFDQLNHWWQANRAAGRTSLVLAYSLGKAQRLLSGLDPAIGPILLHGAVDNVTARYRQAGVVLPPTIKAEAQTLKRHRGQALVVAPPSAHGSTWVRRLGTFSAAMASGWMQTRGNRTRRAVDRGFVLSDHADWQGLNDTVAATGAQRIGVTHGYSDVFVRHLTEQGHEAFTVPTRYTGEEDDEAD
jgi:putative mRNA 3-end processing factor